MGLSYHYEFRAPAATTAKELENFLLEVQQYAEFAGFDPTVVLNVPFDTPERRRFSRRLGGAIRDKGDRVDPKHGVVLVVTDERGAETCFGFLRFPPGSGIGPDWRFRDFIDSPDSRYREIVRMFDAAGYMSSVRDEFQ